MQKQLTLSRKFAPSRREFLAGLSALALAGCATLRQGPRDIVLDTHTHFYDPKRPQGVPWPDKNDPLLYRTVLPAELEPLARPLGVGGTIVVEASPWEEDNQWVLDLAAREPFILGLVGHLKPGRPGFAQYLQRFTRHPLFLGIRTGLWNIQAAPGEPAFARDLRLLAKKGLALDLLVGPDQLHLAVQLAAAAPDLRIVIDHCANVRIDGQAPPAAWADGIAKLTGHRNVHMKVSGLVEGTGRTDRSAPADVEFYRPVLDTIWHAFGEERVLFGSNWPVSARFASYATVVQIVRDYFQAKGPRALENYFARNAQRVYRPPRMEF